MINKELYQIIFEEIEQHLIPGWDKTVGYFELGESSYIIEFYEHINGKYIKCYDIPAVNEDKLFSSFEAIYNALSKERDKLSKKWTNMTFVVDSEGNMTADFDYTDLSDGNYDYIKDWKEHYLI